MEKYTSIVEERMCFYYSSLGERGKRLYTAVEVQKLGHGGKQYIRELFSVSYHTIRKGLKELTNQELYDKVGQEIRIR